jgi:hypothetical protein
MKIFIKTLLLVISIVLVSCAKDDEIPVNVPAAPSIIGKWEYQKADTRDGQTIISTQSFEPLPTCVRNFLNIKPDNKIDLVDHSSPCVAQTQTFTYTLNNNILSYSSANRTIEKLTSTDLILTEPSGPFITAYYLKKVQ